MKPLLTRGAVAQVRTLDPPRLTFDVPRTRAGAVTYLSFICFVLLIAATDDPEWVKGGVQYNTRGNKRFFSVGLTKATQPTEVPVVGGYINTACSSAIAPYMRNWNAGCSIRSAPQFGAQPIKIDIFQDTLGLIAFATTLQVRPPS